MTPFIEVPLINYELLTVLTDLKRNSQIIYFVLHSDAPEKRYSRIY